MALRAAPLLIAAPPPPVLPDPGVVFGRLTVRVGPRTDALDVLTDGRRVARVRLPGGARRVSVGLPVGRHQVRLRARGAGGARLSRPVDLWVLPRSGRRPGSVGGRVERRLQRDVDALVRGLPATAGVYVQHLRTGCGAAVNAAAPFPAASTLKTAILLEALRASAGAPRADLDGLLDAMIEYSDDRAANAVLARLGDGPGRVTALLRGMGLGNALVRRPYIIEDSRARPIPVRATSRPALYTNFVASPHDLARLMVAVQRGATGAGPLRRIGLSAPVVRTQALARLLEVRDSTKIVRGVPEGTPVAHKSGFTEQVKHDAGIVYLPRGPIVVSVMTWSAGGVGDAQGDPFIARVAESAVRRLGAGGRC